MMCLWQCAISAWRRGRASNTRRSGREQLALVPVDRGRRVIGTDLFPDRAVDLVDVDPGFDIGLHDLHDLILGHVGRKVRVGAGGSDVERLVDDRGRQAELRSEEPTSELQSLMRRSYADF